jgi:bacteriocin-like protein
MTCDSENRELTEDELNLVSGGTILALGHPAEPFHPPEPCYPSGPLVPPPGFQLG